MNRLKSILLGTATIATLGLSACASTNDKANGDIYDPYEPVNRAIFSFNTGVDTVVLNPLTEVYRFIVPDAFRMAIANVLNHIKSPVYLANELLQGDLDNAGLVTKRFVLNTFTGFGGILDTASWEGMTYQPTDFGATMASWGVNAGPYIVIPIMGPSTTRDGFGILGDMALDPINWYVWNHDNTDVGTIRLAATVLSKKDELMDFQKDLKRNSLDYYAATRSVWLQRRQAILNGENVVEYDEY